MVFCKDCIYYKENIIIDTPCVTTYCMLNPTYDYISGTPKYHSCRNFDGECSDYVFKRNIFQRFFDKFK
jgi:hypothetical protein